MWSLSLLHKYFYNEAMDGLGGLRVDLRVYAATALSDRNNVTGDNVLISPSSFWPMGYLAPIVPPTTLAVGALDFRAEASIGYVYFIS